MTEITKQLLFWSVKQAKQEIADASRKMLELTGDPNFQWTATDVLELTQFRTFLKEAARDIDKQLGLDVDLSDDEERDPE